MKVMVTNGIFRTKSICVWVHVHSFLTKFNHYLTPHTYTGCRVRNWHVTDMCRHVKHMCHVSGTMPNEFLAEFYPILTPHTPQ